MKVERGQAEKVDENALKKKMEDEETRLRVMMIPRKHRGLYQSMTKARKKRVNEAKKLERKRKYLDENSAKDAKSAKKTKKVAKAWKICIFISNVNSYFCFLVENAKLSSLKKVSSRRLK